MAPKTDAETETRADEVSIYVEETRALLAQASAWLSASDALAVPDLDVHAILRTFHTLKGSAGFFYFTKSRVLAHEAEELLVQLRDQKAMLTPERRDGLRMVIETLGDLTQNIETHGSEDETNTSACWTRLHTLVQALVPHSDASQSSASPSDTPEMRPLGRNEPAAISTRASRTSVGPLFRQLARFATELASAEGKSVEVKLDFPAHVLARDFLIPLRQCLVHLIQNSIAHGVEPPAFRQQSGKPAHGTLHLRMVENRSAEGRLEWMFQLDDDGRGVDFLALKQRVVAQGLVSEADAEQASDEQALCWIWEPGISTRSAVSEIAGRGVGLDFVSDKTRSMGGRVEVMSHPGRGTSIALYFPVGDEAER